MVSLINALRDAGITLELRGDKLAVTGNKELLTPELLAEIKQYKQDLIKYKTKGFPNKQLMQLLLQPCIECSRYYFHQNGCEVYSRLANASKPCRCIWFKQGASE